MNYLSYMYGCLMLSARHVLVEMIRKYKNKEPFQVGKYECGEETR